ncbi:MAG: hypothetical protein LBR17_00185 [Bacteroidales bacterium]|nr:hypothetical protein [Bacteroidales bacterium]
MIEDTDDEAEYVYDNSNANDDNTINNENVYKEETTSHLTSVDTKVELNNDIIKSAINNYYSVVSERRYNEFETVFSPKLDRFFSLHNID